MFSSLRERLHKPRLHIPLGSSLFEFASITDCILNPLSNEPAEMDFLHYCACFLFLSDSKIFFNVTHCSCIYGDLAGNIKAIVASCVLLCQTLLFRLQHCLFCISRRSSWSRHLNRLWRKREKYFKWTLRTDVECLKNFFISNSFVRHNW